MTLAFRLVPEERDLVHAAARLLEIDPSELLRRACLAYSRQVVRATAPAEESERGS